MTHAMTRPSALSLEALVDDMTRLGHRCVKAGKRSEATRIFDEHPGAREGLSVALRARAAMEELLSPGDRPQAQAGTTSTPTAPPAQKRAEEAEVDASEEDGGEDRDQPRHEHIR